MTALALAAALLLQADPAAAPAGPPAHQGSPSYQSREKGAGHAKAGAPGSGAPAPAATAGTSTAGATTAHAPAKTAGRTAAGGYQQREGGGHGQPAGAAAAKPAPPAQPAQPPAEQK